jgi:hypothetical protein
MSYDFSPYLSANIILYMKQTLLTIAMVVCCMASFGRDAMDKWPALKSFHEVIAATYHPSMEGKLGPVKEKAGELAERAEALSSAPRPTEYTNAKVDAAIGKLIKEAKELKTLVTKKAPDAQIKLKLGALHTTFHQIVDLTTKEE